MTKFFKNEHYFNRYTNLSFMVSDMKALNHKIIKINNSIDLIFKTFSQANYKIHFVMSSSLITTNSLKELKNELNITLDQIVDYVNLTEKEFIIKNIIE